MASTINASTSAGLVSTADTSGVLQLQTAGTAAVTVDASQNVGIGTSSPAAPLTIQKASSFVQVNSTGTGATYARFNNSGGPFIYAGVESSAGASVVPGTSAYSAIFGTDGAYSVQFFTNNSVRATLDSSGNLLVGTTSVLSVGGATGFFNTTTSGALRWAGAFENTNASPLGVTIRYGSDTNSTQNEFLYCVGNTTLRTSIRSNGGIANYSANDVNLSDRREKTNFAPAKSYLDVICAIPVQTFNYIDQNLEDDPGLTLGVVAQDVQSVAPELVSESNWGTADDPKIRLSIYQTDLQYALMKCIQEQQSLIQSLTDRIAQLEAK